MPDTENPATDPGAGATVSIEGWPSIIDPEALYTVNLSRPITLGGTTFTPRMTVALKGRVMVANSGSIARVVSA